jgi:hypothetical protein
LQILKRRLGLRLEPLEELYLEMVLSGQRMYGKNCVSVGHHAASCATLVSWLEVDDNMLNERIEMKMATVV